MPIKVNELVIQAKFDGQDQSDVLKVGNALDIELLREEILKECMEKVEEYLKKKETR